LQIGIHTLQSDSFPAIPHQKTTAGVSLAVAFFFVLQINLSFWSALQFRMEDFFLQQLRLWQKYFVYFKRVGGSCGEKDSFKTV